MDKRRNAHRAECKDCCKEKDRARYAADPDKKNAAVLAYRAQDPDRWRAYAAAHYDANRESILERHAQWRADNPERNKELGDEWRKRNAPRRRLQLRTYQAKKRKATPAWADLATMQLFYDLADLLTVETGEPYEVDHIVPLRSDIVCGLHNQFNLAVLPRADNRSKGNRHWPDMP